MIKKIILTLSVVTGVYASWMFKHENYGWDVALLWLISILCFVAVFWKLNIPKLKSSSLGVGLIVFVVAFLTGYIMISNLPYGVWTDEIEISVAGKNAVEKMFRDRVIVPFSPEATGHSGFTLFTTGVGIKLIGNNILALRLPSVFFSALATVIFFFFTFVEFGLYPAIGSSFLLVFSYWRISLTRIGFEAGFYWFFEVLSIWLMFSYFKRKRYFVLVMLGLVVGFGTYTYLAFRFLAIGFALMIFLVNCIQKSSLKTILMSMLVFGYAFGVTISPLFFYSRHHPDDVYFRANNVSILNKNITGINKPAMIVENTFKSIDMFISKGDPNFRHNINQKTVTNIVEVVLVIFGLFFLIKYKMWFYLGTIFVIAALSGANGIFTYEPPFVIQPHSLRTLGLMPLVYLLIAVAFKRLEGGKYNIKLLSILVFISCGVNLFRYFDYVPTKELYDSFQADQTRTALEIRKHCGEKIFVSRNLINTVHVNYFDEGCKFETYNDGNIDSNYTYILSKNDYDKLDDSDKKRVMLIDWLSYKRLVKSV
jgi:hypothetical protein